MGAGVGVGAGGGGGGGQSAQPKENRRGGAGHDNPPSSFLINALICVLS